jgi:hypothetical protein
VFLLDVAYVCDGFQVFLQVFQTYISSVSYVFFFMLQRLHLNVSKVDQVLQMGCAWEATGSTGVIQGCVGPLLGHSLTSPTR